MIQMWLAQVVRRRPFRSMSSMLLAACPTTDVTDSHRVGCRICEGLSCLRESAAVVQLPTKAMGKDSFAMGDRQYAISMWRSPLHSQQPLGRLSTRAQNLSTAGVWRAKL